MDLVALDKPDTTDLGRELARASARARLLRGKEETKERDRLPLLLANMWRDAKTQAMHACENLATGRFDWQIDITEAKFKHFKPTATQIFKALPDEVREMGECQDDNYDLYIETSADGTTFNVKLDFEKAIAGAMYDLTKEHDGLPETAVGAQSAAAPDALEPARHRLSEQKEAAAARDDPPWSKMHHFIVGNMGTSHAWTGKCFDDVYENAPLKVWQWMLYRQSQTKWFNQFVKYARDRAVAQGRDIDARDAQASGKRAAARA